MDDSDLPPIRFGFDSSEDPNRPPPIAPGTKCFAAYAVLVVPLVVFVASGLIAELELSDLSRGLPPWPGGGISWLPLLRWPSLIWFLPLWVYAAGSFCQVLYDEPWAARRPVVRFGVYTGIVLSISFIGLYMLIILGPNILRWIYCLLRRRFSF